MTAVTAVLICLTSTAVSGAAPRCAGKPATIVRGDGGVTVRGTPRPDVIVTGSGPDTINGSGAGDRICSGGGKDAVHGGKGNDKVSTGSGADTVRLGLGRDSGALGPGADEAHGDRGNDTVNGGPGDDRISGELDDDKLAGGGGDDSLIGGLGADSLLGGKGRADLLRGDRGADVLSGGPGPHDLASYTSASGRQGSVRLFVEFGESIMYVSFGDRTRAGVSVNLELGIAAADGGGRDSLDGIEDLLGSPFADGLIGEGGSNVIDGGAGDDAMFGQNPPPPFGFPGPDPLKPDRGDIAIGGPGSDHCAYFHVKRSCGDSVPNEPSPSAGTQVYVDDTMEGASLVVTGGKPANDIRVSGTGSGSLLVLDTRGVTVGEGCRRRSQTTARCAGSSGITHIGVSAGFNDDRVEIDPSVPPSVSTRIRGELGNDTLLGGRGGDIIEGGPGFGFDVLRGRGGNDALAATTGADRLTGGRGADLLIDDDVCHGHRFSGGPGIDSVSFARARENVTARIGGTVTAITVLSWVPEPIDSCVIPDRVSLDVEAFEGSPQDDVLYGNGADNRIQGRRGDDRIFGMAGADRLVGGGGTDLMDGGRGLDQFLARDGAADHRIRCGGPGEERLVRDPADRLGRDCR